MHFYLLLLLHGVNVLRGAERSTRVRISNVGDRGGARIHKDLMRNPISMEYIKIGSVAY